MVLMDDNPASAILNYVSQSGINSLVLGSWSPNCIIRYIFIRTCLSLGSLLNYTVAVLLFIWLNLQSK